jgi:hypothetical protein
VKDDKKKPAGKADAKADPKAAKGGKADPKAAKDAKADPKGKADKKGDKKGMHRCGCWRLQCLFRCSLLIVSVRWFVYCVATDKKEGEEDAPKKKEKKEKRM